MLKQRVPGKLLCGVFFSALFLMFAQATPGAEQGPLVLFDNYHHRPTPRDPLVVSGNMMRYGLNTRRDCDGYAALKVALLLRGYQIAQTEQPITDATLEKASVLVIRNIDSPDYLPDRHPLGEAEIAAIVRFVKNGGSLFLTGNSLPDSRGKSPFAVEESNSLAKHFGVKFNVSSVGDRLIPLPPGHAYFPGLTQIFYDDGDDFDLFPAPGATSFGLLFYSGKPIIAEATLGKGRAVFCGDTGTWGNAIELRPETQNMKMILAIFARLAPPPANLSTLELSLEATEPVTGRQSTTWDQYASGLGNIDELLDANKIAVHLEPEMLYKGQWFEVNRKQTVEVEPDPQSQKPEAAMLTLRLPKQQIQPGDCWQIREALPVLPMQLNLQPTRWIKALIQFHVRSVSGSTATIEALAILPGLELEMGNLVEKRFWNTNPDITIWNPRGGAVYEAIFQVDLNSHQYVGARADLTNYLWYDTNRFNPELDSIAVSVASARLTFGKQVD